ncbi:MAG: response regulator transcription factor [Candidatus Latescibacteria bacterium]|nr:response regulator transcription factor [Candidatus Latescibacterota bacterium]
MSTILVIANDIHGPQLRSDLLTIGHAAHFSDKARLSEVEIPHDPDLILLDIDASEEDVGVICRALRNREAARRSPILAIVDEERVRGLDFSSGVDDFIVKPYRLCEVEARMRLALWRDDRLVQTGIVKVGDILINVTRYEVRVRGAPIELTLKEYELLKYLVINRGRVFTRSDLLSQIWGYDYYGGMRTVDVHIRRVRSKLEVAGDSYIKTIRGVGYTFEPPLRGEANREM